VNGDAAPPAVVRRWPSVHGFIAAAGAFLAEREAEHCLLFGIAATIADHPEVYADPRLWTVEERGVVVAAALRTPPHDLVLSAFDDPRWLDALAAAALEDDDVSGVLGPAAAAHRVADAWSARHGRAAVLMTRERIFRLDRVIAPRPAPGAWREAGEGDRALLAAWWHAFVTEAVPDGIHDDPAEAADRLLRRAGRVAYLWEEGGEAVSLACAGGPTPNGIRIGPVYTPPEQRGRGFASNLVAAVSQLQFDAGRRFCFLFTDLANPTSNHVYQTIGYAPVADVDEYRFPG
jgi:uncharacterized protein